MARHHDVVQVSVNHRLNILGFLDAAEIGDRLTKIRPTSMTDLVAALRWVHENIANFGGDPDRVMIYGRWVAARTVTTLMGMPSAAGLFRRASAQWGGGGNIPSREQQRELARQVMKELALAPNDIGSLQKMEWAKLFAAGTAAAAKINPAPPLNGRARRTRHTARGFVAVRRRKDDQHAIVLRCRAHGFEGCADAHRLGERRGRSDVAAANRRRVACESLQGLWRREVGRDSHRPQEGLSAEADSNAVYMCSGSPGAQRSIYSRRRGEDGGAQPALDAAPAYTYYFRWQTPIFDGLPGAWHTAELQFCFDNTKRCEQGTGNTPQAQALAKKMASSWAAFAGTGNPGSPGVSWQPTDPKTNRTMVWDNESRMVDDPEGEARKILLA